MTVRRLLDRLAETMRWLTGTGACTNAQLEVDRAKTSVVDLDAQLDRVSGPTSSRAA